MAVFVAHPEFEGDTNAADVQIPRERCGYLPGVVGMDNVPGGAPYQFSGVVPEHVFGRPADECPDTVLVDDLDDVVGVLDEQPKQLRTSALVSALAGAWFWSFGFWGHAGPSSTGADRGCRLWTEYTLSGRADHGQWTGTWRKRAGAVPLGLALSENHDNLAGLTTSASCAAREPGSMRGYTFKWNASLAIAHGRVKSLDSTQGSFGPDEQTCSISLDDLEQIRSADGILLRLKGAPKDDPSVCTVRILGDNDTLWIRFGDKPEEGDNCRGTDDMMLCTPRGFWSDLVIDRHTNQCTPVR
jgi:hypothetical protein